MDAPPFSPDLDAYFARIGYAGAREPTLDTLGAIQLAHLNTIPFENVDVLLGHRIHMEPAAVEAKLVHARRGGYCFEQNTLLREVLRALGFKVTALLSRVRRNVPPDVLTPLTHMVLVVAIDGREWLADVGFGSVGITAPLALDRTEEQETPHEPHRLVRVGRTILHQVKLGADWIDVYEFLPEEPAPIDFELGNWFSCTHPRAHFTSNLIASRVDGPQRLAIFNREFTVRGRDGRADTRAIASPEDLFDLLTQRFGINLPAGMRIDIPAAPWEG
ncbi:MAG TPA: arylamine N-acetyltransferase [Opitutaceae bacterium]|nr:arylamine N-acetyltransferase [Opitutaceae bacterium]